MVDGLLSVMTQFSTDVIALCLETLRVVLEVLLFTVLAYCGNFIIIFSISFYWFRLCVP